MLAFDSPRWNGLKGGYRLPYDPRPGLLKLELDGDDEGVWDDFWNNLHHQGDVDHASYAVVPELVRIFKSKQRNWQFYDLITTIELERREARNPALPDWLEPSYANALKNLMKLASEDLTLEFDEVFAQSLLGAIASVKGSSVRGKLMGSFTDDELEEMLELYDHS